MRLAAIFIVAGGFVCAPLCEAAELTLGPTTAPAVWAAEAQLESATRQEQQAKAAFDRVRTQCARRFDLSDEARGMAAQVKEKHLRLELARRKGSPQDRLDASSAYNNARQELQRRRNAFVTRDESVIQADRAWRQAQEQIEAARKQLDAQRSAAAAAERARQVQTYHDCIRSDERLPQLHSIPMIGDEVPIAAVVADPWRFVGRAFVVCGAVEVADYFDASYDDARLSHFSLSFEQLDRKGGLGNHAVLYVPRSIGQDIVDACAQATSLRSGAMKVIRARVTIAPERASRDAIRGDLLEVLDWQFISPNGSEWSAWASQVHPSPSAEQIAKSRIGPHVGLRSDRERGG